MSARLLFIGMLNFADDNGNLPASPKKIKMQVFPADSFDCKPLIDELITQGVLIEYSVNGDKYWNIKGFKKHQKINRPSQTTIPELILADDSVNAHGALTDGKEKEKEEEEERNKEKTNKKESSDSSDSASTERVCSPPVVDPSGTTERIVLPPDRPERPPDHTSPVSPHGAIAAYVRSQGMNAAASDQELRDLISQGATMGHFVDAVPLAKEKGKGWKYLLGIVRNMLQDERAPPPARRQSSRSSTHEAWERINETLRKQQEFGDVIDGEITVVDGQQSHGKDHDAGPF
ncbi:hypothetical protein [Advenella sp. FME57]|uniref:hypothetical protein n=1 Tax=Advenella sp. FME57 TaxID=2742604 RepID=UPI001866445E|nr:hypothetical protein [Advenella sp. FME57]